MTILGRRVAIASATGVLLGTDGGGSRTRATRGHLAVLLWAVAGAFGLAVRDGMPAADRVVADAVPTLALTGAVLLAVVPWRRLPDCAGMVAAAGGAVALLLGVGAASGQLLHYQVLLALVFAYSGITCRAVVSLLVAATCLAALALSTVGAQQDHLGQIGLGVLAYALLGALVGLTTTRLRTDHAQRVRVDTALVQLLATTSTRAAADLAVDVGRSLVGADGTVLLLADGPGATVFTVSAGAGAGDRLIGVSVDIARETTSMGQAVSTAEPHVVADVAGDAQGAQRFVRLLHAGSVLYLPIRGEGGVLGVLVMWWSVPRRPADVQVDTTLTLLSVALGQVLERHRQLDRLDNDAHSDPLTGLGNRRRFDVSVAGMKPGGGVILIDLDGFRPVNEALGHDVGDIVLADFAQALRRCARVGEACRIGGDEFAVVLAEDGVTAGALVAERLAQSWPAPHGVTYSLGFAVHDDASTPAATVTAADMALYAAKRSRRRPAPSR